MTEFDESKHMRYDVFNTNIYYQVSKSFIEVHDTSTGSVEVLTYNQFNNKLFYRLLTTNDVQYYIIIKGLLHTFNYDYSKPISKYIGNFATVESKEELDLLLSWMEL